MPTKLPPAPPPLPRPTAAQGAEAIGARKKRPKPHESQESAAEEKLERGVDRKGAV